MLLLSGNQAMNSTRTQLNLCNDKTLEHLRHLNRACNGEQTNASMLNTQS